MEVDRWRDLPALAGNGHQRQLMSSSPRFSVCSHQYRIVASTTGAELLEECRALLRQHDMSRLAALALSDRERAGVGVEVMHLEGHELAKTGAGLEGGLREESKIWITPVDQPLCLVDLQIAYSRHIDVLERCHPRPFRVRRNLAVAPGSIECGPQDNHRPIRRCFPCT